MILDLPDHIIFNLIPLYEERRWNMIFEKTKSRTTWQVIELYVNFTPNQDMLSQVSGGSSIPIIERQSQRYESAMHSSLHQTSVNAFSNCNTHLLYNRDERCKKKNNALK